LGKSVLIWLDKQAVNLYSRAKARIRILGLSREQADSVPLQERMAGGAYFGRLIRQVENVMV